MQAEVKSTERVNFSLLDEDRAFHVKTTYEVLSFLTVKLGIVCTSASKLTCKVGGNLLEGESLKWGISKKENITRGRINVTF